jgi:hypothetical protein
MFLSKQINVINTSFPRRRESTDGLGAIFSFVQTEKWTPASAGVTTRGEI